MKIVYFYCSFQPIAVKEGSCLALVAAGFTVGEVIVHRIASAQREISRTNVSWHLPSFLDRNIGPHLLLPVLLHFALWAMWTSHSNKNSNRVLIFPVWSFVWYATQGPNSNSTESHEKMCCPLLSRSKNAIGKNATQSFT